MDTQNSNRRAGDEAAAAVAKTPNRVTLDSIHEKVMTVEYYNPKSSPQMTIAILTLENGFVVLGQSAPADVKNFNPELGQKFAFEDAVRKIWSLEGYLLRDRLHRGEV